MSREVVIIIAVALLLVLIAGYILMNQNPELPHLVALIAKWVARSNLWIVVITLLLPLAMTMALIWKTKEVILDSVFHARH